MLLDKTIKIRLSSAELERWKIVAKHDELELSEWIRENCKGSCDSFDEYQDSHPDVPTEDKKPVPTKPVVPTESVPTRSTDITPVPTGIKKRFPGMMTGVELELAAQNRSRGIVDEPIF